MSSIQGNIFGTQYTNQAPDISNYILLLSFIEER